MPTSRDDIKINALLKRMNQQTGFDVYKTKAEAEQKNREEFSSYIKDLSQLDRQDPLRVSPMANENNREERKIEDIRHRERQNIMLRVNSRQRMREARTYD